MNGPGGKRERAATTRRWGWVAAAGALLWAGAALLDRYPVRWRSPEREQPGRPPLAAAAGTAALLVDGDVLRSSGARDGKAPMDFSFAWLSVLEEEVGATQVFELVNASPSALPLAGLAAIVATRSCGERGGRWAAALDSCAAAGALLVLEQPSAALAARFGFELSPHARPATRVTAAAAVLSYAGSGWFAALPVSTSRHDALISPPAALPLLWLDGSPVAWLVPRGRGAVLLLACDVGRWLTCLRQGLALGSTPNPHLAAGGGPLRPSNAWIVDPGRLDAWEPRADLLARTLLDAGFAQAPTARLSPLPGGAAGLLLMAFDESAFGDAASFLPEIAAARGVPSTCFLVPERVSASGLRRMLAAGGDLQLAWDRGASGRAERPHGLAGWEPVVRELALADQLAALRAMLPEGAGPIRSNRTLGQRWDRSPARSFRVLEAQELQVDSSLGPDPGRFGYVYETGRPYRPLDDNSLPLRLLELPFPYSDGGRYLPQLQQRLVEESAAGYRSVLAPSFRPDTMAREPGAHRMRGLLALFELATRQRHPVVSFAQYLEFRADRLAGRVVRADADAEPPLGREPAAVDKLVVGRRFEVVVAGPQQAIEVPGRHASGLVLRQLVLNGFPLSPPAAEPCGWVQLPLPAGRHTLEIRYDEAPRP